jgi:hypothetical protein
LPDHDARDRTVFSLAHWQRFASDLGGFAWLQLPRNSDDVCAYVSKYVVKDGELVLSERFRPDAPKLYAASLLGGIAAASAGGRRVSPTVRPDSAMRQR